MTDPMLSTVAALEASGVPHEKALARALELYPRAPVSDDRLEKQIVASADQRMRVLGFEVVSIGQAGSPKGTRQTPGIADRRYYHRTRKLALWWEAKTPEGAQRPDQKLFQEMVEACGEIYVLGTDEDLYAWLAAHGVESDVLTLTPAVSQ